MTDPRRPDHEILITNLDEECADLTNQLAEARAEIARLRGAAAGVRRAALEEAAAMCGKLARDEFADQSFVDGCETCERAILAMIPPESLAVADELVSIDGMMLPTLPKDLIYSGMYQTTDGWVIILSTIGKRALRTETGSRGNALSAVMAPELLEGEGATPRAATLAALSAFAAADAQPAPDAEKEPT